MSHRRAWPRKGLSSLHNEETEAREGQVTCPRSPSKQVAGQESLQVCLSVYKCWWGRSPGSPGEEWLRLGGHTHSWTQHLPCASTPQGKSKGSPWWLRLPPTSFPHPACCPWPERWGPALHPAAPPAPNIPQGEPPQPNSPGTGKPSWLSPRWKNSHPLSAPRRGSRSLL